MMNYIKSMYNIILKLKIIWFIIVILVCVFCAYFVSYKIIDQNQNRINLGIFIFGSIIGFSISAFFSRPQRILFRGVRDNVYLLQNNIKPRVYIYSNRETFDALGGVWHEIIHVSECAARHLDIFLGIDLCCGNNKLDLKQAELQQINGEKSIFAVMDGVRYGIPDPPTLKRIWGNKPINKVEKSELDKCRLGYDIVALRYWPETSEKIIQVLNKIESQLKELKMRGQG